VAFDMRLAAYDATADRWEILAEADPGGSLPLPMAYDPVNRRLVGLRQSGVADRGGVVAFDPATRTWTQLLAPSTPYADTATPAPTESPSATPAFACPPGTAPDEPGPTNQARPPVINMSDFYPGQLAAFDRSAGRIVALVQRSVGTEIETWTFDVCTNTWMRMEPPLEPDLERLIWAELVYDADSALAIVAGEDGSVWTYDLQANTWTKKGRSPLEGAFRLVYDSASGLVFAQAIGEKPGGLWTYKVETDRWTPVPQIAPPQLSSDFDRERLAYDASVDRIVAYKANRTWLLDPRTGTWSESQVLGAPQVNPGYIGAGYGMAYDEATRQTVAFSDGRVVAYDAAADRWETLVEAKPVEGTGPTFRLSHSMVLTP